MKQKKQTAHSAKNAPLNSVNCNAENTTSTESVNLATKKKSERPKMSNYTRGVSRIYRVLLRLQNQLSQWRPEAEELFSKYQRTGDASHLEAFAYHVTGELVQVRETLKDVGQ